MNLLDQYHSGNGSDKLALVLIGRWQLCHETNNASAWGHLGSLLHGAWLYANVSRNYEDADDISCLRKIVEAYAWEALPGPGGAAVD